MRKTRPLLPSVPKQEPVKVNSLSLLCQVPVQVPSLSESPPLLPLLCDQLESLRAAARLAGCSNPKLENILAEHSARKFQACEISALDREFAIKFPFIFNLWQNKLSVPQLHHLRNCGTPRNWLPNDEELVLKLLNEMIECGAYVEVNERPLYLHPLGLVNTSNKPRLVEDCSRANEFLKPFKHLFEFSTQSIDRLRPWIDSSSFFIKVDVKKAYKWIEMSESSLPVLGVSLKGRYFLLKAMPFGLMNSAFYWNKAYQELVASLSFEKRSCVHFDDLIAVFQTKQKAYDGVTELLSLLWDARLKPSDSSVLIPTQRIEGLGIVMDAKEGTFSITEKRVKKARERCIALLNAHSVTPRDISKFTGVIVSMLPVLPTCNLFCRRLYSCARPFIAQDKWDASLILTEYEKEELRYWEVFLNGSIFAPISQNPKLLLHIDACNYGWGACLVPFDIADEDPFLVTDPGRGYWLKEEKAHINFLELRTVKCAVLAFDLKETEVVFKSDSKTVVAMFRNGGSRVSEKLTEDTREIFLFLHSRCLRVHIWPIPGRLNRSDVYSRMHDDDYCLPDTVLDQIMDKKGPFVCDVFSSFTAKVAPSFFSKMRDRGSSGVNAFAQIWPDDSFVNPPFNLIPLVLEKCRKEKVRCTFVCPWDTEACWFQDFSRASSETLLFHNVSLVLHKNTVVETVVSPPFPLPICVASLTFD